MTENASSPAVRGLWGRALDATLDARAAELVEQLEAAQPGEPDAVEAALATALAGAAAAGQWQTVEALARELEARRRSRAGVASLSEARAKKGGPR